MCVFSIRISVESLTHRQNDHSLTVSTFSFIVFVQLVIFSSVRLFSFSSCSHAVRCCSSSISLFHAHDCGSGHDVGSAARKNEKNGIKNDAWNEVYRIHGRSPKHQFDEIKQLNKFPMMSYYFNALHALVAVAHSCHPCIHLLLQCTHYKHKSHGK